MAPSGVRPIESPEPSAVVRDAHVVYSTHALDCLRKRAIPELVAIAVLTAPGRDDPNQGKLVAERVVAVRKQWRVAYVEERGSESTVRIVTVSLIDRLKAP